VRKIIEKNLAWGTVRVGYILIYDLDLQESEIISDTFCVILLVRPSEKHYTIFTSMYCMVLVSLHNNLYTHHVFTFV